MNTSPESAQPTNDIPPEEDFSGGCILVVDDVPTNVRVLAGILKLPVTDTLTARKPRSAGTAGSRHPRCRAASM
jgi:hypothetical protein